MGRSTSPTKQLEAILKVLQEKQSRLNEAAGALEAQIKKIIKAIDALGEE